MLITATQLKNNLGKYLKLVRNDDSIIITKNGEPIAKIVSFVQDKKSALDSLVGLVSDSDLTLDVIKAERLSRQ
jgi:prevent-host-death family protein